MKQTITLLLTCLLTATTINAQTFEWVKTFGGTYADSGNSIKIDASGNIYTIGNFYGLVDFDPGAGLAYLNSEGNYDVFVQKLDASGNFLWAKSFGGYNDDNGFSISVDASGNVYTTGSFQGTVDFNPGVGVVNLTSAGNGPDIFVQKMDSDGNFLWAIKFGEIYYDGGNSICVDTLGYVYITGFFSDTVDFDPGIGTTYLTSAGSYDVFVLKLNTSGDFLWAKSFGGTLIDNGHSISVDSSGNVYVTGGFEGTADFDPSEGITNLTSQGYADIFVQKMDSSGNFLWAKSFGGSSSDWGLSISVDDSENIYTTGYFASTVDFDPGLNVVNHSSSGGVDFFVQKMDSDGNFLWAKTFGGTSNDRGYSIKNDTLGNVYTAGSFRGTVNFNPEVGTANLSSTGGDDAFIQKMDADGNFLWVQSFGGSNDDKCYSIDINSDGNVYNTGFFTGTVDFDSGTGTLNVTSNGIYDAFIHKMSQNALGVVEMGNGIEVVAYPNPSDGLVQVSFGQAVNNLTVTVSDMQGKVLYTKQLDAVTNTQLYIPGESGIYFLNLKTSNGQSVVKLVKE